MQHSGGNQYFRKRRMKSPPINRVSCLEALPRRQLYLIRNFVASFFERYKTIIHIRLDWLSIETHRIRLRKLKW